MAIIIQFKARNAGQSWRRTAPNNPAVYDRNLPRILRDEKRMSDGAIFHDQVLTEFQPKRTT